MYGAKSCSWCRSTLAYAASASKCDASIPVTRLHGVMAAGVTSRHVAPSSAVTWMSPSSVPIQINGARSGDGGLEQELARVVERVRVCRREYERLSPVAAIGFGALWGRGVGDGEVGLEVPAAALAAVDHAGMQGIAGRVSALAGGADRLPVALRDLRELAARAHRHRTRVLLRADDPVGKAIVDRRVVDLRCGLIEPRAPGHIARIGGARVAGDDRALVARDDQNLGLVWRNPHLVVIVAAG